MGPYHEWYIQYLVRYPKESRSSDEAENPGLGADYNGVYHSGSHRSWGGKLPATPALKPSMVMTWQNFSLSVHPPKWRDNLNFWEKPSMVMTWQNFSLSVHPPKWRDNLNFWEIIICPLIPLLSKVRRSVASSDDAMIWGHLEVPFWWGK